jgi:hypothetical protein
MSADSTSDDKPKQFLGLSGTQTIGSALAAVTSAFVGSFLGVAGTLIGAALGSVVATVGAALYARTLSSAATMARTKMPLRQRNRLLAEEGDPVAADTVPATDAVRTEPARKAFTPRTWIKLGAVSAAAFVLAMVGLTVVEVGTNQPISSLVSSTSSIDGSTEHTTTLGKALTGTPGSSDENPADNGRVPALTEEGSTGDRDSATDSSPIDADSGPVATEEPALTQSGDSAQDLSPETEQSQAPGAEDGVSSEPEVLSDSGTAEQPGL